MTTHPILDLHMHTSVSDGTDTPAELLTHVREAGIDIFSVTDHDAIAGCEQIQTLLRRDDPKFLFGVEFSCKDAHGKYHILGYGYNPNADAIRSVVETGHANRIKKLGLRLRMLRDGYGISFPDAEIDALYAQFNPGKPHLANLMVRFGYAESVRQAFSDVLNHLHIEDDHVLPEEAIAGILGAGGIPVLAHPCFGDGEQRIFGDALYERVKRLKGFGLLGLEAYYSGFTEAQRGEVLALADTLDLCISVGSDYHGKNKPVHLRDTGLSENAPLPERLELFLNAAFAE